MENWKRLVLTAGLGGGFAIGLALIAGAWLWYQGRPTKLKPWNTKAIVAAFDYPDIESSQPGGSNESTVSMIVLYYTLENTTDSDYHMPPQEQLEVDARLKREKSLSGDTGILTLDKEQVFIPAKQRRRFSLHLNYSMTKSWGPEPKTKQEQRERWKLIADYLNKELTNLDGFVVFDSTNRFQINLPGWSNIDLE